jgi:creatinine amidohydrolase
MHAAADRAQEMYGVDALVLPALPFGPTPEHRNYGSGYIDIPVNLHEAMIEAILTSLADQGFRRILLWRGCGGHDLKGLVARFNAAGHTHIFLPDPPFHAIWCRVGDPAIPGGHADSFTTSMCLYLRPEGVRTDRIVDPGQQSITWDDEHLDFAQYSSTGVIGDPTHASAELGKELWLASVEIAAAELANLAHRP